MGSFSVTLGLRRDDKLLPSMYLGEEAIHAILSGLQTINQNTGLPQGFDQGVLFELREAGRILDRGIYSVQISTLPMVDRGNPRLQVQYLPSTRERIVAHIRRSEQTWAIAEGQLLMADVKEGSLRCRLHPSIGSPIMCSFSETIMPLIIEYLRLFVRVRGEASIDSLTDQISYLAIRDIEPIDEPAPSTVSTPFPTTGFGVGKSFDDLAAEQSVYPIEDWDTIAGKWPQGADFDDFLEAIRGIRQESET